MKWTFINRNVDNWHHGYYLKLADTHLSNKEDFYAKEAVCGTNDEHCKHC